MQMNNTMIPTTEQQALKRAGADPSTSFKSLEVGGNVQGNITVGNENVVGDNNVVYQVHTGHGAVVNLIQSHPAVSPRTMRAQPLRLPRGFVGRESYLDKIRNYIKRNEAVLVHGQDGIGKTALLAQASNSDAALAMRDGVVALEGIDEEGKVLGLSDIIQRLFDALFESNPALKVTSPSARPYLSNTQPVVILDHFNLPVTALNSLPDLLPTGALLIASQDAPFDDTYLPLPLLPLEREESIQLLINKSGIVFDETMQELVDKICELLGDIPLAISQIATLIRNNKATLERIADHLTKVHPPSQNPVQAAIERAYGMDYSILTKEERKMLAVVAAAPGRSVERSWLENVAGGQNTSTALEALELLTANSPRMRMPEGMRYVVHSNMPNLSGFREILLDHIRDQLKSRSLDFQFVGDELGNILGLLQWAAAQGRWTDVIELGRAVDPYLTLHGLWDAWESVLKQLLVAGQNLKNLAVRGWALHQLGTREIGVGRRTQAIVLLQRALTIRISQGDLVGAAQTLHNLRLLLPQETKDGREDTDKSGRQFQSNEPGFHGPDGLTFWQKIWRFIAGNPWIIAVALLAMAVIAAGVLQPSLRLKIQATPERYSPIGQPIEFSYRVDNAGLVRLGDPIIVYTEDQADIICPDLDTIGNEDNFFDWNETITCTGFYTITEADVKSGSVTHSATAYAGKGGPSSSDSITIRRDDRYLMLSIQANPITYRNSGETITVAYLVKNVGREAVSGFVAIADDKLQADCPDVQNIGDLNSILDANELLVCTATYKITDTDVQTGSWTSKASVSVGDFKSDPQTITIYGVLPAELALKKSAKPDTYQEVGQEILYTYEITNSGTDPLKGPVTVSDENVPVECPELLKIGDLDNLLEQNELLTCKATYTINDADIEIGSVTNTATAITEEMESESQSVTIYRASPAILALDKSAKPETYESVGQEINYTYLVTNQSEGRLSEPVTISDDLIEVVSCPEFNTIGNKDGWFDSGEMLTCMASYLISQTDIDRRSVTNTAWASAGDIRSTERPVTINLKLPLPALFKSADPTTYREVGEQINYTFAITNPGSVPINGPVAIQDDKVEVKCPDLTEVNQIAPRETFTCTGMYRITEADIQNGSVTNMAWAIVGDIISVPSTATIFREPKPVPPILRLTKSAEPESYRAAGEQIKYTYFIENEGKGPAKGPVTVEDDKTQVICPYTNGIGDQDGALDPGEQLTCTAIYTITDADLENGSVTNTALASAGGVSSNQSSVTIYAKALNLIKRADPESYREVAQVIQYTYEVTGKSKLPLRGPVAVTDDKVEVKCPQVSTVGNQDDFLDWGETILCSRSYSITQADLDNFSLENTAVASVGEVNSVPETLTVWAEIDAKLSLKNTPNPDKYDTVGQMITYTYAIVNSGNVTLFAPFRITDDHFENNQQFDCQTENQRLAPNESTTCSNSKEYTISQTDFNYGNSFVTTNASASVEFIEEAITSPTVTTTIVCPYPREPGWFLYTVEVNETLDRISSWYNIEQGKTVEEMIAELQKVNCMGSLRDYIEAATLYVPGPPPLATISGIIRDTAGQPLENTPVRLINIGTGSSLTTVTGANGRYIFSGLQPGTYRIFQIQITVRRGDDRAQNFTIIPEYGLP